MAHVNILKFGVSSPADTSPLKHLKAAGYDPSNILAVIGKSEGKRLPIPQEIVLSQFLSCWYIHTFQLGLPLPA
jgi:hypothetical protein